MIEQLKTNKNTDYHSLLRFVTKVNDYDFYFTENNERFFVTDVPSLKRFIKSCRFIYVKQEQGEYVGLVMLWKSDGGGKERFYLKMRADSRDIARDMVTALLWNVSKEIFVKVRKDSFLVDVLKQKGFRFLGGRGIQILLSKKPNKEILNARSYNYDRDPEEG